MIVRGKWLTLTQHAREGMDAERPPVGLDDLVAALEEPDHDSGTCALRWIRFRTLLVYYEESDGELRIRSVSATT